MLMQHKAYALDVYNALNDSNYTDPELIEIVELDQGVSLSMRNDASCIIDSSFSLYEHQSTYNPNMPLRSLLYYTIHLKDFVERKDLYGRRLIRIPTPNFVVFYNGTEERPEYEEMRLSQAFSRETDKPQIQVICKVYNINPDYNTELKHKSEVLCGYTCFVEKVRVHQKQGMEVKEAVALASEACIREHVLEGFFRERKDEIINMAHLDYTWERREELIREEEYADGYEQGRTIGIEQGIEQSIRNLMTNLKLTAEQAMDALNISEDTREKYLEKLK